MSSSQDEGNNTSSTSSTTRRHIPNSSSNMHQMDNIEEQNNNKQEGEKQQQKEGSSSSLSAPQEGEGETKQTLSSQEIEAQLSSRNVSSVDSKKSSSRKTSPKNKQQQQNNITSSTSSLSSTSSAGGGGENIGTSGSGKFTNSFAQRVRSESRKGGPLPASAQSTSSASGGFGKGEYGGGVSNTSLTQALISDPNMSRNSSSSGAGAGNNNNNTQVPVGNNNRISINASPTSPASAGAGAGAGGAGGGGLNDQDPEKFVPRTKALHTHHYSEAELKKMNAYDSVDAWEPITDLYLEHIDEKRREHRYLAWLIYCLVGLAIGFWAIVVFHSIDALSDIKMNAIAKLIQQQGMGTAFAAHVFWSTASGLFATLTCVAYPNGAGGGVPEVMAQLNGISMPEQVKAMVIFAKTVSVIFAVHSGMAVGAEGPMIQFGSIIGGLVCAGRTGSQKLNEILRPLYRTFQNPKDQRDFVTAGAAAGVTSVFASPIGGFLFVMEELASFMNPKVAWMTFSSCLCCYLFVQVGGTYLEGWKAAEIADGADAFKMNPNAVTLFNQNIDPRQFVPATILSLLPAAAVAIGMGVWAAGFIHLNLTIVSKWRWKYINAATWRKVLEPVLNATIFAVILFSLCMALPCQVIPDGFTDEQLVSGLSEEELSASSGGDSNAPALHEQKNKKHHHSYNTAGFWRSGAFLWAPKYHHQYDEKQHEKTTAAFLSSASAIASSLFSSSSSSSSSSGSDFVGSQLFGNASNNNNTKNGTDTRSPAYYGGMRLHTAFCSENAKRKRPTHYQTFASLAFAGAYNTIRLSLSRHTEELLDVGQLALYFFLYSFGAVYSAGMFMASGIVIPTLVIGATGGRLIGAKVTAPWSDPGVMALMGAASFFSGLSRLTVSLVVIMIEISDDLSNVAVMMICVIISKFCADALSHSLYHEQLQMRGVPFLDFDTQVHNLDKHCAADIMTPDPICLPIVSTVSLLFRAAKSKYSGFPVLRRGVRKDDLKATNDFLRRSKVFANTPNANASTAVIAATAAASKGFTEAQQTHATSHLQQNNNKQPTSPSATSAAGGGTNSNNNSKTSGSNIETDFTFLGTISREMCGRLLWHLYISESNSATSEPPIPHYYDLLEIDDFYVEHVGGSVGSATKGGGTDFWLPPETSTFRDRLIDLSPFINSSAFFVPAEMSVSRAYNLFRSMTLRHLCVVDGANQLIGIIGRKDMLGHFLNENVKRKEELLLAEKLQQS